MTIALPADLEAFIRSEIESGRYADETDVIRDAVRRLADARAQLDAHQLEALRRTLQPGLEDAREGRFAAGGILESAKRAAR
jgi:putative addiction module CopG family antidote